MLASADRHDIFANMTDPSCGLDDSDRGASSHTGLNGTLRELGAFRLHSDFEGANERGDVGARAQPRHTFNY